MQIRALLDYDFVISALMRRTPYTQIAARETQRLSVPVSRNVIAGVHRDLKQGNLTVTQATSAKKANIPSLLNRPTFRYGVDAYIPGGIPVYNGHPEIRDDAVLVINDLHGTKVDIELLQRTDDIRKYFDIKRVIIAGDLADNAALNMHRRRSLKHEANLRLEMNVIAEILEWLAPRYDNIDILPGNHDLWLIEAVDGVLSYTDTINMLIKSQAVRDKVSVSDYDRLTLYSGERVWTIAHQAAYNPTPLVTAQKLSEQFETDIYTTHQHISAGPIRSRNGKHLLMDVGGLFDPAKFEYVQMQTRIGRQMEQGFATIINGKPKLWTPDSLITDWKLDNEKYA